MALTTVLASGLKTQGARRKTPLMPSWDQVVDPEPEPDARAPPNDWDGLGPPAPDF